MKYLIQRHRAVRLVQKNRKKGLKRGGAVVKLIVQIDSERSRGFFFCKNF